MDSSNKRSFGSDVSHATKARVEKIDTASMMTMAKIDLLLFKKISYYKYFKTGVANP